MLWSGKKGLQIDDDYVFACPILVLNLEIYCSLICFRTLYIQADTRKETQGWSATFAKLAQVYILLLLYTSVVVVVYPLP